MQEKHGSLIKVFTASKEVNHKLKPYQAYKNSGLPWVGEIPVHWKVFPNRAVFIERNIRNHPDEELLSVTINHGVIRQSVLLSSNVKKDLSNEDKSQYKLVEPGDIVYNKMRAWQGAFGVSNYRGIVSPAYIVVRLKRKNCNPRYFHYLFRTASFTKEFRRWSYGITSDQWSLRYEDFKRIYSLLPPIEEQDTIVQFLDNMDYHIFYYIQAKRRLIELLEDQKQAVIQRAITHGVNTNVRFKPSGIDWLGDIPENWKVYRLKNLVLINPSKLESEHLRLQNKKVVFLPMERVSENGEVDYSELKPISEVWDGYTYFRKNDVVIAKITPCFENGKGACLKDMPTEIGFGSTEFIVLRPINKVLPEYLYFLTRMSAFRKLGKEVMTGAAGQQRVPIEFVKNFPVAIPPYEEQQKILED